jgi:hypothetical protein
MLDRKDASESTLRLILWKALESYPTNELCELLSDPDPIVRTSAAKQLHLRADPSILRYGMELCTREKAYLREIGAFVLGQLGTPKFPFRSEAIGVLARLLSRDRSAIVRSAAAAALGHLGADEAKQVLLKLTKDQSQSVRLSIAFALGRVSANDAVRNALRRLTRDRNQEVREWARLSQELAGK